jgi:hypothetical protein
MGAFCCPGARCRPGAKREPVLAAWGFTVEPPL